MNLLILTVLLILGLVASETDIITLNDTNFEALTQASTGATTGSWLIKFYAPWCGHCKNMQPAYEEVATELKGEVNVAEVDVAAHRSLGSRFDIKGFPTLLYLNGGKLYKYKGARNKETMVNFVRETYKDEILYEPSEVPAEMGYFGEVTKVFKDSYNLAQKDISGGNYFTVNVLTCALPVIFILFSILLCFIPVESEEVPAPRKSSPTAAASVPAITTADADNVQPAEKDKDQ